MEPSMGKAPARRETRRERKSPALRTTVQDGAFHEVPAATLGTPSL
jgi:hypothetical protein